MPRVLIVDDSAMDRKYAAQHLERGPQGNGQDGLTGIAVDFAATGREALDLLARGLPDLVITDLIMPGMTGLELVEQIRDDYPSVPVVLMTAHGSEDMAIDALQRGAAGYVPKRRIPTDLLPIIRNVLDLLETRQEKRRLLQYMQRTESYFVLENDHSLISPLVLYLEENFACVSLCDDNDRIRVGVALREAVLNAMHHGNLEVSSNLEEMDEKVYYAMVEERLRDPLFRQRRVHVIARGSPEQVTFIIRDDGPGFDPDRLPDPTDPDNLEKARGRGLLLIRTFMDEVRHNERGNEITMVKRRRPSPERPGND